MFRVREYVKAESLEEAYQLNQKRSSVLVGGMMWLKMERIYKVTAIDLSGLGLNDIEEDEEGFRIGCMCTLRQLELHEGMNRYFNHVFRECTRHIVGVQFRNTATVGGSVFGRYGFSDILTCLMMLDTTVELYKGGMVSLSEFAGMKYDRDILVRIHIKKDGRIPGYMSQRNSKTDFPVIACAVAMKEQSFYVAVGAKPEKAELVTIAAGTDIEAAARSAVAKFSFHDNMRASGEYRRHLAYVYVKRLMEQAVTPLDKGSAQNLRTQSGNEGVA